jgi:undecaprenyl-diphosphatase
MTLIQSLILGIVEGVTEFLPISSTGHLILAGQVLNLAPTDFLKSFEIIIQLGAILAVIFLYSRLFLKIDNLKKVLVGFLPTGLIGLLVYKIVKIYLIGNGAVVLWSLGLGGLALIIFELWHREPEWETRGVEQISYRQALIIGLCQSVAIIPGVSRSAASIVGGLALGLKRQTVVEFSFLLAVPTMLAATGLDLFKNAGLFSGQQGSVLAVGLLVSFIVALFSIKFLLGFIKNHNFIPFGIYRLGLALLGFLLVLW